MINLSNVKGLVVLGKAAIMAHRPELLFAASVVSTVTAAALGAKGGYEARGIVDAEQERRDKAKLEETQGALVAHRLTTKEKANLTWHCYWPAAAATLAGVGSTTGLHIVHVKEKKQLAAMALLAIDEIKKEAQEEMDKRGGPLDKDQQNKVLEQKDKGKKGEVKVQNTDGEIEELFLVREPVTGRDIWSNKARIDSAMVEVGNIINGQDNASLNHFFDEAGWGRLPLGDKLGWSGIIPDVAWHDENGQPISGVRDDGRPWRGFRFRSEPEEGYSDSHR